MADDDVKKAPEVKKTPLEEARENLAEAESQHADEVAAEAARVEKARPKAVYGKHILLDLGRSGAYEMRDAPKGWNNDRSLTINGQNVEHVSEGEGGAWCYRAM